MTAEIVRFGRLDGARVRTLLCDMDDCLFASEEPAFVASTEVTNRFLEAIGIADRFTPGRLRRAAAGRNFRATALAIAADHGVTPPSPETLEAWVAEERREVVAHLVRVLRPDPAVRAALLELAGSRRLAVVTSSALTRAEACLGATRLDDLFPESVRFSAEDSLPEPASKPDPAIYRLAVARLEVPGETALAVEDSVSGVRAAVGAGVPCVGLVQFVRDDERAARIEMLREAGAVAAIPTWSSLHELL